MAVNILLELLLDRQSFIQLKGHDKDRTSGSESFTGGCVLAAGMLSHCALDKGKDVLNRVEHERKDRRQFFRDRRMQLFRSRSAAAF